MDSFEKDMRTTGAIAAGLGLLISLAGLWLTFGDYGFAPFLAIIAVFLAVTSRQMVKGISETRVITLLMWFTGLIALVSICLYFVI